MSDPTRRLPALADARWPQVEEAAREVLVVPLGSLEQHGPHLPLDTDAFIAQAVATRLHAVRPHLGLAPLLPLGSSGEHAGFAGTLSIGTKALAAVLVELVRDAARDWGAVVLLNGHGGNLDAVREAGEVAAAEGRRLAVVHLSLPDMDAHAGRAETSIMLHLAPERVDLGALQPGALEPVETLLPRLRTDGVRAVSPNGVLGDPRGATAQEGDQLMEALVAKALAACVTAAAGSAAEHLADDLGSR